MRRYQQMTYGIACRVHAVRRPHDELVCCRFPHPLLPVPVLQADALLGLRRGLRARCTRTQGRRRVRGPPRLGATRRRRPRPTRRAGGSSRGEPPGGSRGWRPKVTGGSRPPESRPSRSLRSPRSASGPDRFTPGRRAGPGNPASPSRPWPRASGNTLRKAGDRPPRTPQAWPSSWKTTDLSMQSAAAKGCTMMSRCCGQAQPKYWRPSTTCDTAAPETSWSTWTMGSMPNSTVQPSGASSWPQ